jgi:hypothetical protein
LATHGRCNQSYQHDEDYFFMSVAPLAMDSYSGRAVFYDIKERARRQQGARLARKVLAEFDKTPGGLYLPAGRIVKRFDGSRVGRVLWKVTRGLFFHEHARFLPETTPRHVRMLSVGERPPAEFGMVRDTPSRGKYPGVFDYKMTTIPEIADFHYWAMLLWDRLIVIVAFHDPDCACPRCATTRQANSA